MLNNNLCEDCEKAEVCRLKDILYKFDESAKKPLGVDLTIERCKNFAEITMPEGAVTVPE